MHRRAHTRSRRHTRRSPGSATLRKKVEKLWQDAEVDRPAKHILFSNQGITGGNPLSFYASSLINSSPQIGLLTFATRGTTVQSRLADYIFVSAIKLRMLTYFGTGISGDARLNWMVIRQKNGGGVALTANAFALDYFGDATPVSNSIPNRNNKELMARYQVLKRGVVEMHQSVASAQEIRVWNISLGFKVPKKVGMILGNAGTAADIDGGAIYLFMWTDGSVSTNGITTYVEGNVYFRDQN